MKPTAIRNGSRKRVFSIFRASQVLVLLASLFLLFAWGAAGNAATPQKPNVLVIVADDMGFSDAGCYGGEIATPNLDRLAQGGLRFTQFYNTARCWPSRACILTGYYAQQVRRDALPGGDGGGKGVRPAWARLLPELLRPLGYRSYHAGKWHVDGKPVDNGFDRSYENSDSNHHFLPAKKLAELEPPLEPGKSGEGYYTSTAVADYTIRYLKEHAEQHADHPFFAYVAFTEPHFPVQAPQEDIDLYRTRYLEGWDVTRQQRYERIVKLGIVNCPLSKLDAAFWPNWNLTEEELREQINPAEVGRAVAWNSLSAQQKQFQPIKMAIHAAMVHRVDTEIGRVLKQVQAMGAFDNTLIMFVSDNGASAEQMNRGDKHDPTAPPGSAKSFLCIGPGWSSACNTPMRLHKSWVHEGGISTPLIAQWPKGIAARGELRRDSGHLIDLAPTILELAGGKWPTAIDGTAVPPPPGKSLVPAFAKDGSVVHDYLWWYHIGNRAIRMGDWKLVAPEGLPWELYNLRADRSETTNLAAEQPEKAKALEAAWTQHMEEFRTLAKQDVPAEKAAGGKAKAKKKRAR